MSFEHFVANFAVKSFDVLVKARNVLFECISSVESFAADVTNKISLVSMTLLISKLVINRIGWL
jgi:hypothetical protein